MPFLFIFICPQMLTGQALFWQERFDTDPFFSSGWFTEDAPSSGISPWRWAEEGKAAAGAYWNDRPALSSPSGNGALVFDSDSLQSVGGTSAPHYGYALSPPIDLGGGSTFFLEFYQYYRNYQSLAIVEVILETGEVFPIYFSESIGTNVETSCMDRVVIELPGILIHGDVFQLRFIFQGELYFWIIDDISIYDAYPYPVTFPNYIGDSLQAFNKAYDVDKVGTPIVPNQLVVQFKPGVNDADKQDLRDSLGVDNFESCMCDQLELWNLLPTVPFNPGAAPSSQGPSIGINERKTLASASSRVDGVDLNKYNWNDLQTPVIDTMPAPINTVPGVEGGSGRAQLAIMDTGVDYEHPYLQHLLAQEYEEDNNNCLPMDTIGWNFVDENNNPWDNHRHGTHLSGIALRYLSDSTSCSEAAILPIKTHDAYGVSDLFDVSCGMYYALQQGANVINCSWGWIGDSSEVLSNVIDSARLNYNAIIVAASGNDTLNLEEYQQYPVCSWQDNVIGVAAANDAGNALSGFSNASANYIDIAAYGDSILSTVPGSGVDYLSGTSMAAPAVAATLTAFYCLSEEGTAYTEIIQCLLDSTSRLSLPENLVAGGRLLQLEGSPCLGSTGVHQHDIKEDAFKIYPNPTQGPLWLEPLENITGAASILILNNLGQQIFFTKAIDIRKNQPIGINLEGMPPSCYYLFIQSNEKQWSYKVVKTK